MLLIHREGGFFPPTWATIVEEGDKVMVLTSRAAVSTVCEVLRGREPA